MAGDGTQREKTKREKVAGLGPGRGQLSVGEWLENEVLILSIWVVLRQIQEHGFPSIGKCSFKLFIF